MYQVESYYDIHVIRTREQERTLLSFERSVGLDHVLFWFCVRLRKFLSRKPRVHFPEAGYMSSRPRLEPKIQITKPDGRHLPLFRREFLLLEKFPASPKVLERFKKLLGSESTQGSKTLTPVKTIAWQKFAETASNLVDSDP